MNNLTKNNQLEVTTSEKLNLQYEVIVSPFDENIKVTKFKSFKNNNVNLFSGLETAQNLGYVNMPSALKQSECIPNQDYFVLEKKNCPVNIWKDFENLGFVSKFSPRTTILFESGYWKLMLHCTLKNGAIFRNWLAASVIPSISNEGKYTMLQNKEYVPTFTYIIKDTLNGYYKIGKTTDVAKRMSQLKTGNVNLEPFVLFEKDCEKILHDRFKDCNVQGEWFNLSENNLVSLKDESDRVIEYNFKNCVQVSNQTPKEIKKAYGRPNDSAKEILRKTKPECAMTMTMNDYLVEKYNLEIEQLKETDEFLTKTFQSLGKLGITLNIK